MRVPPFAPSKRAAAKIGALCDEVLDTTTDPRIKLAGISRRDFARIGATFGATATMAAVAGMGGVFSAEALAQSASATAEKRYAKPTKHTLKFGPSVLTPENTKIQRVSVWEFIRDVEEKTEGELRFEVFDGGSVCAEPVCMQKVQQGVLDMGSSSTANAASQAPWLNALDFPYMFKSRGQLYNFFLSPTSEKLFRSVYRKRHGVEMLWTQAEMRSMWMGEKWRNKPPITDIDTIAGTKNRVTNTQIGRIAMQLMELNPVPVAWTETLDAMKSGLIDGMETWGTAVTAFNMTPAVSQMVGIEFFPGCQHMFISTRSLEKLGSNMADSLLESAFQAQRMTMYASEAGLAWVSGQIDPPAKGSIFEVNKVQMNFFSAEAKKKVAEKCSPTRPEYASWHEKLNGWAGFDVYKELSKAADEYPADALAMNVPARRWWMSS